MFQGSPLAVPTLGTPGERLGHGGSSPALMLCLLLSLQQGQSSAGHGPPGAGESPRSQPPSTIPQPLLLPQGMGGHPISLDTAMVSRLLN